MYFKTKIGRSFIESCVGSGRDDAAVKSAESSERFEPNTHFGFFYSLDRARPVAVCLESHDDTLSTARCHRTT
jgi:hypothetical protein